MTVLKTPEHIDLARELIFEMTAGMTLRKHLLYPTELRSRVTSNICEHSLKRTPFWSLLKHNSHCLTAFNKSALGNRWETRGSFCEVL